MNFTSGEWLALITAISALVVVVGGVIVNIIVSLRTSGKVAEVAVKVDGAASAAAAEIKTLRDGIAMLKDQVADQKQTAAVLAQTKTAGPEISTTDALDPSASLDNIDKNTKAIERNTAKTDETVDRMEKDSKK